MPRFIVRDIACFREWHRFNNAEKDHLLDLNPGHNMAKAASHPCVVLKTDGKYALITTVSAHGANAQENWRAPWTQGNPANRRRADRYRSFEGTERFNNKRPFLRLSKGGWPKPRGSWVNIETVLLVPVEALGLFWKAQGFDWTTSRYVPHVDQESFDDLLRHIIEANRYWSALLRRYEEVRVLPEPLSLPSPPLPASTQTKKVAAPPAARPVTKAPAQPTGKFTWAQVARG